ncbi:MAG: M56 family metallopeptidase [Acidobacteriota bacterium]|nr:M56 family metallopeptidase [Acidobacteriota bacterium]
MTLSVIHDALTPTLAVSLLCLLLSFLLKTGLGFGCSWLMTRFATSAAQRFSIWLTFLVASSAYWVYSLAELTRSHVALLQTTPTSPLRLSWTIPAVYSSGLVNVTALVLGIYMVLLLGATALGVRNRILLYRATRLREPAPETMQQVFATVAAETDTPRATLWLLPGIDSPATAGILRPGVYLPLESLLQPEQELASILRHELTHVRRRDSLWELLSRVARALLCFHPLVHRAFEAIRFEREVACDMAVVHSAPEQRDLYAETLVRFGWRKATDDSVGIGLTSASSVLSARVQWILRGERIYSRWSRRARTLVSAGLLWSFAVTAPALLVVFRFAPIPQLIRLESTVATEDGGTGHHSLMHGPERATALGQHSLSPTVATSSAPRTDPDALAAQRSTDHHLYQVQNADEPMSNPAATAAATGSDPESALQKTSGPSGSLEHTAGSVAMDTATQVLWGEGRESEEEGVAGIARSAGSASAPIRSGSPSAPSHGIGTASVPTSHGPHK